MTEAFAAWTQRLLTSVSAHDDVLALVLLGSAADTARADRWSDHDFYLVVRRGQEERFRTHLDWLPDTERIVLAPRETAHGLKVMYDDGHVLEFAVAHPDEVLTFGGTPYDVALDRIGLADRMTPPAPSPPGDDRAELELFLTLLVIGAGRAARGEELAAGQTIREHAAARLVGVLSRGLTPAGDAAPDPYNPARRFEARFPDVAAEIGAALARRPLPAAEALLDLAERHLADQPDLPRAGVRTVREVLARTATAAPATRMPHPD